MAKAKKEKVLPLPQSGGSFNRDPDTGQLTKGESVKAGESAKQKETK